MAVHASLGRRNAGKARSFYGSMAITAVDAEPGNMVLVTEWDRLRPAHPGISDIRRALNLIRHPAERGNHEDRAKNRGPGQRVRTAMKNLRHAYVRILRNYERDPADFNCGSLLVTTRMKIPTYFFASARRNANYKYFARTCRVLHQRIRRTRLKLNSTTKRCVPKHSQVIQFLAQVHH